MKKTAVIFLFIFCGLFLYADGQVDPIQDCCQEISRSAYQVSNSTNELVKIHKEVLSTLKEIEFKPTINIENPTREETNNNASIIGAIVGALFSGLAAIFVFWLGKRKDDKQKKTDLRLQGQELYYLLKNIVTNLEVQLSMINDLIDSLKDGTYTHIIIKKVGWTHIQRARSFETNRIFSIFRELDLPPKKYINYYSHLDFLDDVLRSIDSDCDNNNESVVTPFSNMFIATRNEIFNNATDYLDRCRKDKKTDDKLYQYLNSKIVSYYEKAEPEPNIFFDVNELVRPMKDSLLKEFRDYDIANVLLHQLRKAGDIAQSIFGSNDNIISAFKAQVENIKDSISGIEEIKDDFEKIYEK